MKPSKDELHSILSQIDAAYNGQMELSDYLQVKFWYPTATETSETDYRCPHNSFFAGCKS